MHFTPHSQQLIFLNFALNEKGRKQQSGINSMSECLDWHSLAKKYADPCINITNASEQTQVSTSFQGDRFGCLWVSWHALYPSQMCTDLIFNKPMEEILVLTTRYCLNPES